ncbi:Cytochrome P450 4B1 [Trichoplax sp. H2]|nr:Cytochrome P450 4B1 [Trichoplax sp. H2]|eukprot:RDD36929.1 Cytochrome P450 4B1 [Trichoplax sp. H2]
MLSWIEAIFTIVIAFIVIIVIRNRGDIIQYFRIWKSLRKFPSPPSHWLMGHLLQLGKPDEACIQMLEKRCPSYDTCFVHWFSIFPVLCCNNSDAAKDIIKASSPKGSWFYKLATPWLGHGLIAENGPRWARNRRLLTSAFHYDILKNYVRIYNDCIDTIITKWKARDDKGESFDTYEDLKLLTLDVILQTAFSIKLDCQTIGKNHPYITASRQLTRLLLERVHFLPYSFDCIYRWSPSGKKFLKLCHYVNQFSDEIISRRKETLMNNNINQQSSQNRRGKHMDFVDILLQTRDEDGYGLNVQEIRDEVNTFMFAGHDTTSSALAWTLYCLAKYPQHQDKVREEADGILCDKDNIDYDDLQKLNYTHMCIKEAMRIYTPVPTIERKLNQDLTVNGMLVPASTTVFLQLHTLCRRSEVWPNPYQYDPQRFTAENIQNRDPYHYIPFSAGQRNCIGKNFATDELKIVVAKLVHHLQLEIDPKMQPTRYYAMVNQPDKGIWLKIKRLK